MTELHVGDRVVVMPFTPDSEPGRVAEGSSDTEVMVETRRGELLGLDPALVRKVSNGADRMGNFKAKDSRDECSCGSKYWEFDTCVDCRVVFADR